METQENNQLPEGMDSVQCKACRKHFDTAVTYCTNCGYPFDADFQTQSAFIAEFLRERSKTIAGKDEMRKGANALFGAAVLYLVSSLISSIQAGAPELIAGIIVSAIFVGLGIWAQKQAMPALISGISLFTLLILAAAILEPATIVSGFLWKLLIYGFLIRGIKAARDYQAVKDSELDG